MTNRLVEGFDWLPSNFDSLADSEKSRLLNANGMFPYGFMIEASSVFRGVGRFGFGASLYIDTNNGSAFSSRVGGWVFALDDPTPIDEGFIGVACYVPSTAPLTQAPPCVGVFDGVNDEAQLTISFEPNGVLRIWRGLRPINISPPYTIITAPNLLASSHVNSYQQDEDFQLEFHPVIADTGGSCEVRVNTVPVISLVGADTAGGTVTTTFDSLYLGGNTPPIQHCQIRFDDIYCNDTDGATCNTWGGTLRVKTMFMIADGFTNDFTIGGTSPAATNWQSVLNQALNDTKYVFSATPGDIDLYDPDPILNAPLVRVVQVRKALRQDDATQRSAKAVLRINGVNYDNPLEHFTNQSYTFYKSKWEINPDTGVEFTGAEVNGLEPGVKVES